MAPGAFIRRSTPLREGARTEQNRADETLRGQTSLGQIARRSCSRRRPVDVLEQLLHQLVVVVASVYSNGEGERSIADRRGVAFQRHDLRRRACSFRRSAALEGEIDPKR